MESNNMKAKTRNPYRRGLITTGLLAGAALLAVLASLGLSAAGILNPALVWISLAFLAVFALIWLVIWLLGVQKARRAAAFLASGRPLVRWTYTTAEWQHLKEIAWQEERQDWKVQWGCLAVLLAIAGLLAGGMVGLEDGWVQAWVSAALGAVLGGLAGVMLGALVAGGNTWGALLDRRQPEPAQVALAPDEIYNGRDYFCGNGKSRFIKDVRLQHVPIQDEAIRDGKTPTLELQLAFPPRPRMPEEEEWSIAVPPRCVGEVETILPRLAPNGNAQTSG